MSTVYKIDRPTKRTFRTVSKENKLRAILRVGFCLMVLLVGGPAGGSTSLCASDAPTDPNKSQAADSQGVNRPVGTSKRAVILNNTGELPLAPDEGNAAHRSHYWNEFVNMLTMLFFIVAFIVLTGWFLKRIMRSRLRQANSSNTIKILEKRNLTPKSAVYLLEVHGRTILVSESADGIQYLTEFSPGSQTEAQTEAQAESQLARQPGVKDGPETRDQHKRSFAEVIRSKFRKDDQQTDATS